jgi:hypothetical protein
MQVTAHRAPIVPRFEPITITLVLDTQGELDALRILANDVYGLKAAKDIVDRAYPVDGYGNSTVQRIPLIKAIRSLGGALWAATQQA